MGRLIRRQRGLGLALIAVAMSALACSRDGAAVGEPKVELTDGQVTVRDSKTFAISVRYRFAQGKPLPTKWYTCMAKVSYNGKSSIVYRLTDDDGATLPAEGVVQKELNLGASRTFQPGTDVTCYFTFGEEVGKGGAARQISNQFEVTAVAPP